MQSQYLLGVLLAVIVVGIGIFLLGRDGTEGENIVIVEAPLPEEELPVNPTSPEANQDEDTEEISEPETESPEDTTATDTPKDLPVEDENIEEGEDEVIETEATTTEDVLGPVTIIYSDSGYAPKEVIIAQGDTVVWVNESTRDMWVGSNIHPTHTQYPESSEEDCLGSSFDTCERLPNGSTWEFTFNAVGEWGYHDHLNPSRTGKIIVE